MDGSSRARARLRRNRRTARQLVGLFGLLLSDLAGHVDHSPLDDGWVSGRGTDTLVVHGYPIEVDATALGLRAVSQA